MHATGAIDTTAGLDGYYLTQANTSVAKLTPYVQLTQTDDVTLDDNGGATHHLVITFYNNPTGPIYGYPTYRDYVRIYVPPAGATARREWLRHRRPALLGARSWSYGEP